MRSKRLSTCVLQPVRITLKPIRNDGETLGFAVHIIQKDRAVKYVYMFPMDRCEIMRAILTKIGNDRANLTSRRR